MADAKADTYAGGNEIAHPFPADFQHPRHGERKQRYVHEAPDHVVGTEYLKSGFCPILHMDPKVRNAVNNNGGHNGLPVLYIVLFSVPQVKQQHAQIP